MNLRTNALILALALLSALGGYLLSAVLRPAPISPSAKTPVLRIGDQRVNLALPDVHGQERHFAEWDGKLILINFWATWCAPCRQEMTLLNSTEQLFRDQGLAIVGIAMDDADAVAQYLKQSPVDYPILLASTTETDPSILFGDARAVLPYSVLIGRDGKLIAQHAGSFNDHALQSWIRPHL